MTTKTSTTEPLSLLTTAQVCTELQIARSTLYKWWDSGSGPVRMLLPNRTIRVRRADLEEFLVSTEVAA